MTTTQITTAEQLNSVPGDAWVFGRRSYWRIARRSGFRQMPETGSLVYTGDLPELVALAVKPSMRGMPVRCYNPGSLDTEVMTTIKEMGLSFDSSNRLVGNVVLPASEEKEEKPVSAGERLSVLVSQRDELLAQIAVTEAEHEAELLAEEQEAERIAKEAADKAKALAQRKKDRESRKAATAKDLAPPKAA